MARCLERLERKRPPSVEVLKKDIDLQDIVILNLERLVQLSVDAAMIVIAHKKWSPMPSSMAQSFDLLERERLISSALALRLRKSVGFRNLCVHAYDKVNWDIVDTILRLHLQDFKEYAAILDSLIDLSPSN